MAALTARTLAGVVAETGGRAGSVGRCRGNIRCWTSRGKSQGGWGEAEERGAAPFAKRSLGQNFMIDRSVAQRVVEASRVEPGTEVVEIGPGRGALTRELLDAGATVLAVEKDDVLAAELREALGCPGALSLIHEDFLDLDPVDAVVGWREGMNEETGGLQRNGDIRARVISNIPYNITKPLLEHLLPCGNIFSDVVLMLQAEAAERLVEASPNDSDYRAFSTFVHYYATPEILFNVPREAFSPRPRVDSRVVRFLLKTTEERPEIDEEAFHKFTKVAFASRRKTLRKNLHMYGAKRVSAALEAAGLSHNARAQELSVPALISLFRSIRGK